MYGYGDKLARFLNHNLVKTGFFVEGINTCNIVFELNLLKKFKKIMFLSTHNATQPAISPLYTPLRHKHFCRRSQKHFSFQ